MAELLSKGDLLNGVSEDVPGVSKADVGRIVASLQDRIVAAVAEGKSVKLSGFAAFDPKTSAARTMRSPQTGEPIEVPERKGVKIRPLSAFIEAVRKD